MVQRHQGLFLTVLFLNIVQFAKREYIQHIQFIECYFVRMTMPSSGPLFDDLSDLAGFLRLIGNPLRLTILFHLLKEPRCVCELADTLNQRQPCISQHLMLLRHIGLVDSQHDSKKRLYYISSEKMKHCLDYMQKNWLSTDEIFVSSGNHHAD